MTKRQHISRELHETLMPLFSDIAGVSMVVCTSVATDAMVYIGEVDGQATADAIRDIQRISREHGLPMLAEIQQSPGDSGLHTYLHVWQHHTD